MMRLFALLAILASLFLSGCSENQNGAVEPTTEASKPALWKATRSDGTGGSAWLMGTVHLLPADIDWQGLKIDKAIEQSSHLVVEVAALEDQSRLATVFSNMGIRAGLPPLSQRIAPDLRSALNAAQKRSAIPFKVLDRMESWAAALTLAAATSANLGLRRDLGVERVLTLRFKSAQKSVAGLETIEQQFGYFDQLSEADQRAMLNAVLRTGPTNNESYTIMLDAWLSGNNDKLLDRPEDGILATPGSRIALLERRNQIWTNQIATMIDKGERPFVAVGAAHLAGKGGVQALLETKGYKVIRIQ